MRFRFLRFQTTTSSLKIIFFIILLGLLLLHHVAEARKIPSSDYAKYDLKPRQNNWFKRLLRWLFPWYYRRRQYQPPDSWQTTSEIIATTNLAMPERIAHMECIDIQHELLLQQKILKQTSLLIISPTLVKEHEGYPEAGSSVYYPTLYLGESYHIAFKIGLKYPHDKPYLSIFLTRCETRERPDPKNIRFIRSFYIKDRQVLDQEPNEKSFENWRTEDSSEPLLRTKTGIWHFKWNIPDFLLFPGENYCFLFDMSSLNPSDKNTKEKVDQMRDLKEFKPDSLSAMFQSTKHYHDVLGSPKFTILEPPERLSATWLERLLGGPDLNAFMGGQLFTLRYYQAVYKHLDVQWNNKLYEENIRERAESVSYWLMGLLKDDVSSKDGSTPLSNFDSGFQTMESRRHARIRAVGLMYHPYGRETLTALGNGLLDVANAYERTLKSFGRLNDYFVNYLGSALNRIYQRYFGKFSASRRKVYKWTLELRRLLQGRAPNEKILERYQALFNGKSRIFSPELHSQVASPYVIEQKLLKHITLMAQYEIQMTMWEVGNSVLKRRHQADRWFETLTGSSAYSYDKYIAFASTLKTMGSKFISMANTVDFKNQITHCFPDSYLLK